MPASTQTASPQSAAPVATYMVDCLHLATGYAKLLIADISPEQFCAMPHPTMNSPAFCLGHLSLYPDRCLSVLGYDDRTRAQPGWEELFKAGVDCVNELGRYPARDSIVNHYFDRHKAIGAAVLETDSSVFERKNPTEGRFGEMCPTIGAAVNFLLNGHHMVHLGQISAWRRAMGMPAVM